MAFSRQPGFLKPLILCWLLAILTSCGSRYITTAWKTERAQTSRYSRILVVAVVPEEDSLLREQIEDDFTSRLGAIGYPAVSALRQFGPKGLTGLGEESTYVKLCSKDIDAVFTIALVPVTPQAYRDRLKGYVHPNSYYYKRIWNYKKMQETTASSSSYFWESILFDLAFLEARATLRTQSFTRPELAKNSHELAADIIKKLLREDVLEKPARDPSRLKGF